MNKKNQVYVFDLDGTLANAEHRVPFIQGDNSDWDAFYEACDRDLPIYETIHILRALHSKGHGIYILTGRSDQVKAKTEAWLAQNYIFFDKLKMRPEGNYNPDHELKVDMLTDMMEDDDEIMAIFEDRNKVVEMWRDQGFTCYHVADGDF